MAVVLDSRGVRPASSFDRSDADPLLARAVRVSADALNLVAATPVTDAVDLVLIVERLLRLGYDSS